MPILDFFKCHWKHKLKKPLGINGFSYKKYLFIMVSLLFGTFCLQSPMRASTQEEHKKKEETKKAQELPPSEKPPKKILPRHVLMPRLSFSKEPSVGGKFWFDFSSHRYWLVFILSTWNKPSTQITRVLNQYQEDLSERDIFVAGLFSHSTAAMVSQWRSSHTPLFFNEFASQDLIDTLKNPSIPTLWVVGQEGEILKKQEQPSLKDLQKILQQLIRLTNF